MTNEKSPFELKMIQKLFDLHGAIKSPTCAICQKQVNKMDVGFRMFDEKYVISIECHGDKGEIRIHEKYALNPKYKFEVGEAFTPKMTNRLDGVVVEETVN